MPRNLLHTDYRRAAGRPGRFLVAAAMTAAAVALALLSIQSAAAQSPATLTLTVPNTTVSEDAGAVTVTAALDQPAPAGGVRVTLTSRPIAGRARVGSDFTLPPAFTIAENQTTGTADITLIDDVNVEPDKQLVLNATVNVPGITVRGVTFTLVNDDMPRLTGLYVYPQAAAGEGEEQTTESNQSVSTPLTPRFSESPLAFRHSARVNPDVPSVIVRSTGVNPNLVKMGLKGFLRQTTAELGNHALSYPISLSDGENVIEVQVTAYGKTSTYTITVTRGLLPAPAFSVAGGARDGGPTITVTLADQPPSTHEMRVQVRESTTDPWPDAAASNLLPSGASAGAYTRTFNDIVVTGLAKGTDYEVRAHLVELSGSITDPDFTVISQSGAEAQVTTLSSAPAPTGLTLTPTKPGTGLTPAIQVSWSAVENAGRVWYRVRWREADQTPEAAWSGPRQTTQTGYSIGPLEDGAYDVQVASDNGIEPVAWSEIKQATVNHSGGI